MFYQMIKKFSNPQFWGKIFKFIHSFIPVWLCLSLSENYYVSVSPTRTETLYAREELCFILAWIHLGIKLFFSDSYHSAALKRERKEGSRSVKIIANFAEKGPNTVALLVPTSRQESSARVVWFACREVKVFDGFWSYYSSFLLQRAVYRCQSLNEKQEDFY